MFEPCSLTCKLETFIADCPDYSGGHPPQHELDTPLSQTLRRLVSWLCPSRWVAGSESLWALFLVSLYGWENWNGLNRASYFSQSYWKKIVEIIMYFSHSKWNKIGKTRFSGHMSACHSLHLSLKLPTWLKDFSASGKIGRGAVYSPTSQGCCEDLRSIPYLCSFLRDRGRQVENIAHVTFLSHILGQHLTAGPLSQGFSLQSRAL